jgi:hypothetical protein
MNHIMMKNERLVKFFTTLSGNENEWALNLDAGNERKESDVDGRQVKIELKKISLSHEDGNDESERKRKLCLTHHE